VSSNEEFLRSKLRTIPDFPKKGITFVDITTLLLDPDAFELSCNLIADTAREKGVDKVVGIESRGFIFGGAIAEKLHCGFVPVRKPGKLPYHSISYSYDLEYGSDSIEIHEDALDSGNRVLVIDDLMATGGTLGAACALVEKLGAQLAMVAVVVELCHLKGREALGGRDLFSLVRIDGF